MSAYQTVVVGTDGSDSSYLAVERAAEVAQQFAAKLVIVCAYTPAGRSEVAAAEEALGDEAYQVVGSAPAEETLRTAGEKAAARGAAAIDRVAVAGEPVRVLIGAIADYRADLLVVGNRGLNTLAGRLLGSVPADASRRAPCDVLIVHTVR